MLKFLIFVMLKAVMLSVKVSVMKNVFMLNVANFHCYLECSYAEGHLAECRSSVRLGFRIFIVTLSVVNLNVIMPNVVAPTCQLKKTI
jgi:hypothetical protein